MKQTAGFIFAAILLVFLNSGCAATQPDRERVYYAPFIELLNSAVTNYVELKNALVNNNSLQAAKEASEFWTYLNEENASSLDAVARQKWVVQKVEMMSLLEKISEETDVMDQRELFAILSNRMEALIQYFGPLEQTLYKQYCSEALAGKGASWLNEKREILNPYGETDSSNCGEIVKVIEGSDIEADSSP